MPTVPDWIRAAAEEIERGERVPDHAAVAAIIAKHCPFQEGVAYMPVPRCETCRHWTFEVGAVVNGKRCGRCDRIGCETSDGFGCVEWEKREP